MVSDEKKEKIKIFLTSKLVECERIIVKYRKKYMLIKIVYYSLMTTSIIGSTTISIVASYTVPPLFFVITSGCTAVITAIGLRFNIEHMKIKLNKKIQELNKIKDKLDYVVSCNGDLTEDECHKILRDFRSL